MSASQHGYTWIELLATLAITAVFLIVAVPSYHSYIQINKIVSVTNKFAASFNLARMEVIKRGARVSVCPSASAAYTTCGSNAQWALGWIIFTDSNNNNAVDSTQDRLKIAEAPPSGIQITSSANIAIYDGTGFLVNGPIQLRLSATGCYGQNARIISIAASGRLSVSTTSCT